MRFQFKKKKARQTLNYQFKYLLLVLLVTLVLIPFEAGAQAPLTVKEDNTLIKVSKGEFEDFIKVQLDEEALKSWHWSVRRKLQYSNGNYVQLQVEMPLPKIGVGIVVKDEAVEKGKAYIYEFTCVNEHGLYVYRDTGYCGKLIDTTWYTVEISKGCFADAVQIYIQTNDPKNFYNHQFFQIYRKRRHSDEDWIKIDRTLSTIIIDDSTIPNEEYDYRIEFRDRLGKHIFLEDYGYRVGPAPRAVITQALTPKSILVGWDAEKRYSRYRVQVKVAGDDLDNDCQMTAAPNTIIDDLINEHFYVIYLPDTTNSIDKKYEWRVRGEVAGELSDYSDWTAIDGRFSKHPITSHIKSNALSSKLEGKNKVISFIRAYLSKPTVMNYNGLQQMNVGKRCLADHYNSKYKAIEVSQDLQIAVPFKFSSNKKLRQDTVRLINNREMLLKKLILLSDKGEILYDEFKVQELPIGCNALFSGSEWNQSIKKPVIFYIELSSKDKVQHYPVLVNLDIAEANFPLKEKIQLMLKNPKNY